MALIKCPECKREVSDKAEACIHCGYPIAKLNSSAKNSIPLNNQAFYKIRLIYEQDKLIRATTLTWDITGLKMPQASALIEKNYSPIIIDGLYMEDAEKIKKYFKKMVLK